MTQSGAAASVVSRVLVVEDDAALSAALERGLVEEGYTVVTETVFNLPGLARFLVEAILWRDYPIVQNLVMFIAIVVIVSNLVVDMLYGFLDPRVRYGH